jgi:hypothetical protein
MDRLESGRVGAGKSYGHILELDARPGRIGVGMNDPHKIGPIRPIQLAGDLDRYTLARTRREPVEITDQRDHGPNLGPLYLRIRNLGDHLCGKGSATRPVLKRSLNARHLSAEKAKLDPASTVPRMKATSLGPVSCVALMSGLNVKIPNQPRREGIA